MVEAAVSYYGKKFGQDVSRAFIHLTRELGELARGIEQSNSELAKLEITELAGLLFYLAEQYGFNLTESIQSLYAKKLQKVS